MRYVDKDKAKSGEFVEVINMFQAFHVNYVVNGYKVVGQICREYDISRYKFQIISSIYGMANVSPNRHRSAPQLPSFSLIYEDVKSLITRNSLLEYLKQLTESHFIKMMTTGGRRGKVLTARTYDLDYNGYLVTRRYATLMSELYRENYFSRQADRKIKKAKEIRNKVAPLDIFPQE